MKMEPYEHHCSSCEWVGWYMEPLTGQPYNVYLCGREVVIRHSSAPSDIWCQAPGEERKCSIDFEPRNDFRDARLARRNTLIAELSERVRQLEQENERLLDENRRYWKTLDSIQRQTQ